MLFCGLDWSDFCGLDWLTTLVSVVWIGQLKPEPWFGLAVETTTEAM